MAAPMAKSRISIAKHDKNMFRVITCLENLEMSGNLTAVREMSGILLKVREIKGKKWLKNSLLLAAYLHPFLTLLNLCIFILVSDHALLHFYPHD